MSASSIQRPPDGDQDRGPAQIAIWWTEFGIIIIRVILRFHTRIMIRSVGIDDWMMLVNVVSRPLRSAGKLRSHKISQVVYGITCSLVTYLASIGGFRHMFYLRRPGDGGKRASGGGWRWFWECAGWVKVKLP